MAGFLSGAAVSTKYPAIVFSVAPLTIYVGALATVRARADGAGAASRSLGSSLAIFLLAMLVACGPWLVKNAALTGNPTYPLLYDWFDGATRTAQKDAQWRAAHDPPNYALRDLANRAWTAAAASDWLSPLVVPLAVLSFWPDRNRRLALALGGYLLFVFAAWWLLTHRIDRFLLPAMPLAAMLAGMGATWSSARAWRIGLVAFLAFGLIYNVLLIAGGICTDNRYLADLNSLRVDARRVNPWHLYFNAHRDEVRRLMLVGDAQAFDVEVPVVYNTVFDDSVFEQLSRGRTPAEIRRALDDRGISHIYVAWDEIARYRRPGNYGVSEFLQPQQFADLVTAGVLEPLPALPGSAGQAFRIVPAPPNAGKH
jgi:hypothetical protein